MTRTVTPLRRALYVLLLAALIPIVPFVLIGELPGDRWLAPSEGHAGELGVLGALLLALDVLLPIPSSILGTLLGARLGFGLGFAWTWLGLCVGLALGYAVGRLVPSRYASELPLLSPLLLTFLSRPVPVLAEAVAVAAGVERVSFARYFAAGSLGNAVYAAVLAADGAELLPEAGFGVALIVPMLLPVLGYGLWKLSVARSR